MERNDTIFDIRYAVRVLERYGRFWSRMGVAMTTCTLFSAGGAVAAIAKTSLTAASIFGIAFTFIGALNFALRPAEMRFKAIAEREGYAKIWAAHQGMSDQEMEKAYWSAAPKDPCAIPDVIRRLAYNDVVDELGLDQTHKYPLGAWDRLVAWLA